MQGFEDTRSWSFFESMSEPGVSPGKNSAGRFDGDARPVSAMPAAVSA